ncbi:MAG: hypothetical protein KVP17_003217 [Porospora cf. gigantea B]|uniref:uncharacterized protein n=1 Tax=Porospora cf. gigantea B TaxID=2853592 RepID=UPI003571C7C8|nr:MAG: hypothetical protein KVP17_003217 [Porospora cf. gigantea B]
MSDSSWSSTSAESYDGLRPAVVTVKDFSYFVPDAQLCKSGAQKQLLFDCTLSANPGELLAIIGPSGCGKTTLLNNIAQRTRIGTSTGGIALNGVALSPTNANRVMSFVMTQDKQLPYLTVEETLHYSARLKLPHMQTAERNDRVEALIQELGLVRCRDTPIGGQWKKGISTGELKLVSIGVELLENPSVLLLDEPTSGLDAARSMELINLMATLAKSGRTIIMTIHQPRSQIFSLFDRLLVMSKGRVLYCGDAKTCTRTMANYGYICPDHCNPADFMLDLVSIRAADDDDRHHMTFEELEVMADNYRSSPGCREVAQQHEALVEDPDLELERNVLSKEGRIRSACSCSGWMKWLSEIGTLCSRMILNSIRNPVMTVVMLFVQGLMGLLLGALFYMSCKEPHTSDVVRPPEFVAALQGLLDQYNAGVDGEGYHPLISYIKGDLAEFPNIPTPGPVIIPDNFPISMPDTFFDDYFITLKELEPKYAPIIDAYPPYEFKKPNFTPIEPLMDTNPDPWYLTNQAGRALQVADFFLNRVDWSRIPDRNEFMTNTPFTYWLEIFNQYPAEINALLTNVGFPYLDPSLLSMIQVIPPTTRRLKEPAEVYTDFFAAAQEYVTALRDCDRDICKQIDQGVGETADWIQKLILSVMAVINAGGLLFFSVSNIGFAAYDSLLTFPQERGLFNRERSNHMYSASSWYIAKNLADLPFQLVPTTILVTTVYFLVGLETSWNYYGYYLLACVCTSYAAYGFGYMISAFTKSLEVTMILAPLLLVNMLALSGFFVREETFPVVVGWMKYLSYYRWGFYALVTNQFREGTFFAGIPASLILLILGIAESNYWVNVGAQVVLGLCFRLVAFFALKYLHTNVGIEI